MVARAYGEDQTVEGDDFATELGHGWFNVAYSITLRDGRQVVLKIAPPPGVPVMTYEVEIMSNEVTAMRLAGSLTKVPVPPVDFYDNSGELCASPWFFMPLVEGENLGVMAEEGRLTAEQIDAFNEQLGAANAELNRIVGPHFGPLEGDGYSTWREAFTAMIEDALHDGQKEGVDLGWDYELLRSIIAEDLPLLDGVREPRFVEWDLWNSNTMVREDRITGIIDHERAFYGDPLMEAGFVGLDLPDFGDPEAFIRGYGLPSLTAEDRQRRRLYTLYLIIIMVVETHYRGHETPDQYWWARGQLDQLMGAYAHTSQP